MDYSGLILLILQTAPGLAVALKNLFSSNPQKQGETDDAYILRLKQESATLSADTKATDAAVENS